MPPTRLANSLLGSFRAASRRPAVVYRQTCAYHSYDYAAPPPFPPAESAILSSAYAHVPAHGFTIDALKLGARDAGYLDASTNLLPRGVFDLVNYHLVTQRLALADNVQFPDEAEQGKKMGVGAKVRALTLARLRANEPVVHRWQEALAIMAQPSYIPASLSELASLADEIWFLSGDQSVDSSWYTKRASLSTIYSATEVFMTQDKSPDFIETEQFLDNRLQDLRKVGGFMGALSEWVGYTGHSTVNVLRSKGVPV
ncbi:ubiquinone biosynthesis protein COQ9 [Dothidotthia symphoricarpi CBS 119687]|uniref:Ubiquinone biosynthesis protein n=1 Tax=Dothidotthia symphoricarpi CBS 119687 TaxID=1392245 RepID=A0A6A6ARG4_9PLEO|nr:ubiquinone biosynthesis protein COQ9 [Dothidotthia symphoricarpi CBS 119687]KAF2134572.1 ubiquinone biosynthesis protein COQ9 [Dothidotthia symphoricarpi CBS 119687]